MKTFTGSNEAEIWTQVAADMGGNVPLNYRAQIEQGGYQIHLVIDIDLGGGFEGGFEMTVFSAMLASNSDYRFAIHNEDFLAEIGKLFGMQDVELGYPEFDQKVVVKTNDDERTRMLFASQPVRTFINELTVSFSLGITGSNDERKLEMTIEKGITDLPTLQKAYGVFYALLMQTDKPV